MEAIISASPRALVVPAGTGWGGPGRQELGEHWDGANTGAHMDVSAVPAPPRPELLFTVSSAQTMGYFQCGLQNAPGLQKTLPALPVLGVSSGPGRAHSLLCTVAQQCPHMSLSLALWWHRLQGRQEQPGAGPSAGPGPDHFPQVCCDFPQGKSTAIGLRLMPPFPLEQIIF